MNIVSTLVCKGGSYCLNMLILSSFYKIKVPWFFQAKIVNRLLLNLSILVDSAQVPRGKTETEAT